MESSWAHPKITPGISTILLSSSLVSLITQLPNIDVLITPAIPELYQTYFFLKFPRLTWGCLHCYLPLNTQTFHLLLVQIQTAGLCILLGWAAWATYFNLNQSLTWAQGKSTWKGLPFSSQAAQSRTNWRHPTPSEMFSFAEPFSWQWKVSVFTELSSESSKGHRKSCFYHKYSTIK